MKKTISIFLFVCLALPVCVRGEAAEWPAPGQADYQRNGDSAVLGWKNPEHSLFEKTSVFRSTIPIESFFTYEAVDGLCDQVYSGAGESYTDTGLAVNLPYYYILFARYANGSSSKAVVLEKDPEEKQIKEKNRELNTLAGAGAETVNQVSFNEAGTVYNFNRPLNLEPGNEARRLSLFIIAKSPHDLKEQDKRAISYFIHDGTPTTILLGAGERAGVLNSYLSVFDKLPTDQLEWQDIIKIANGRWPDQRSPESEDRAANVYFSRIYSRSPDMDDPNDNAAVTVIAYGLRPGRRNLESEKQAIEIYRSIFNQAPSEATDWDLVRAIAYSGAVR